MAKQRYNIGLDSLSYDNSQVPYVAPPTKEILAFMDKGEERYLKTKAQLNLNEEIAKKLKFSNVSKPIYDEAVANMEAATESITPENYADKELDTAQIAHDFMNKWGGTELEKQQAQFVAAQAEIDKAEGIRGEKRDYYSALTRDQLKPIIKDETGQFIVPNVATPTIVKDIDLYDKADKLLTGWKSSGNYVRNSDGSLSIDPGVLGQLGITKTQFNDEKELYNTVVGYLSGDPTNKEYLQSEADMALYNKEVTPEYLKASLPANIIQSYFPNKKPENITVNDIQNLTGGNQAMLKDMAKHGIISNQMNQVGSALASKHGFTEETKSFFDDKAYSEELKFKYIAKTKALEETVETATQLIIPQTASTMQIGNPTIYETYSTQETAAHNASAKAKEELLLLEEQDKVATPDQKVLLKENLANARQAVAVADQNIQRARQAQDNLTNGTMTLAQDKGVNVDKAYNTNLPIIRANIDKTNAQQLINTGYSVDITSSVKPNSYKDNTIKITLPKYGDKTVPVYSEKSAQAGLANNETEFVVKIGNSYKLYSNVADRQHAPAQTLFNTNLLKNYKVSQLSDNPYNITKEGKTTPPRLLHVPTAQEYANVVSKLFMNPDANLTAQERTIAEQAKVQANAIKAAKGKPSDVKVNQTLDYLYVSDKAKAGTGAYRLKELENTLTDTLISQGSQYKVRNNDGEWETLPLYLKSLGLEYTSDDIDFKALKAGIMTTSDRKYGQQYNLPLPLTKEGRAKLRGENKEIFGLAGVLNLTAVSATGRDNALNQQIADAGYKAYLETYKNNLPSNDKTRKAIGQMTFDQSPYAESFYDLNLYTLGHGKSVPFRLPDGHKINITAVKRSAIPDKLGDNDYFISNENGDVFAYDVKTGRDRMVSKKEYEADTTAKLYRRKTYASPEDIGALIGTSILDQRAIYGNNPAIQTQQVKTTGSTYIVKPESVISNDHRTNVNNTTKQYGTAATPRAIKNYSGKEVVVNSRINPSQMTNVKDLLPNKIKPDVYPYFNTSIANEAVKIVNDYDLYLTDAYRPEDRNKKLEGSAKNSLHQYGKSMDSSYNAGAVRLLADISKDPQIAKNLGISYAFKHIVNGVPHLHIDFI